VTYTTLEDQIKGLVC